MGVCMCKYTRTAHNKHTDPITLANIICKFISAGWHVQRVKVFAYIYGYDDYDMKNNNNRKKKIGNCKSSTQSTTKMNNVSFKI